MSEYVNCDTNEQIETCDADCIDVQGTIDVKENLVKSTMITMSKVDVEPRLLDLERQEGSVWIQQPCHDDEERRTVIETAGSIATSYCHGGYSGVHIEVQIEL